MPPNTRRHVRLSVEDGPDVDSAPIAIRVGAEPKTFFVYETPLCLNSMFFANALKKEWKEGESRQVDLPDVHPDTFRIWVKWLYTGRLCYAPTDSSENSASNTQESKHWRKIYALADFLQDADLKDAAIDAHIESMREDNLYSFSLARDVYPYSNKKSAHRKLAVDLFVEVWARKDIATERDMPMEFYADAVIGMGPNLSEGLKPKAFPEFFRGADPCKYHDHGSEKPCYKTRPTFLP